MDNRLITLKEFVEQWKVLIDEKNRLCKNHAKRNTDDLPQQQRRRPRQSMTNTPLPVQNSDLSNTPTESLQEEGVAKDDPYDCSDLAVPDVYGKVNEMLPSLVQAWRNLDDRKITAPMVKVKRANNNNHEATVGEESSDSEQDPDRPSKKSKTKETVPASTTMTKKPMWYQKHVRFPENFDYLNQGQPPPPLPPHGNDANVAEDRVVNLTDPTQPPLSYEHELWHFFDSVPTSLQIEESLTQGMALHHTQSLHKVISEQFKRQSLDHAASAKYGLYALRMRDRHDYPRPPPPVGQTRRTLSIQEKGNEQNADGGGQPSDTNHVLGTITLELWRKPADNRSQPTPDSSRMVLEFLGSQTLLDVHRSIVDLTDDTFWTMVQNDKQKNASISTADKETEPNSGFFFVEGTFYTTGSVDYVTPIQAWLQSGNERMRQERAAHLGLAPAFCNMGSHAPLQDMSSMALENLPVRFGTRYCHVHHGDVECSWFVVDMACHPTTITAPSLSSYPRIHDVWTPSYPSAPECHACQRRMATLVTSTQSERTNGHKCLCSVCAKELSIPFHELQDYVIWHRETELSLGAPVVHKAHRSEEEEGKSGAH